MGDERYCTNCDEYVRPLPYGGCPGCEKSSGLQALAPGSQPTVTSGSARKRSWVWSALIVWLIADNTVFAGRVLLALARGGLSQSWNTSPLAALLVLVSVVAVAGKVVCAVGMLRRKSWGVLGYLATHGIWAFFWLCAGDPDLLLLGTLVWLAIMIGVARAGGPHKLWRRIADDRRWERMPGASSLLSWGLVLVVCSAVVARAPTFITDLMVGAPDPGKACSASAAVLGLMGGVLVVRGLITGLRAPDAR